MNGVHDLGGMHGFGPVVREADEPVFHHDWERRVFSLALATLGSGSFNIDEFRHTIEKIPPERYLASSYYERWLRALEAVLREKGVLADGELEAAIGGASPVRRAIPPIDSPDRDAELRLSWPSASGRVSGAKALRRDPRFKARFRRGDRVVARVANPEGHTRVPRYVRGRRGVVRADWGTFVFPDSHAHGLGANPQHCYAVEFAARELWGAASPARDRLIVDLWEAYLDHDRASASPQKPARRAPVAGGGTPARKKISVRSSAVTKPKRTTRGSAAPRKGKRR
jgi:nitrile hydratase